MGFKVVRISEQAYDLIHGRISDKLGTRTFAEALDGLLDDELQARRIRPQIDQEFDGWSDVRVSTQATLHDDNGNPLSLWQHNLLGAVATNYTTNTTKIAVFDRNGKLKHRQFKDLDDAA